MFNNIYSLLSELLFAIADALITLAFQINPNLISDLIDLIRGVN